MRTMAKKREGGFCEGQRVKIKKYMGGGSGVIVELSSPSADIWLVKKRNKDFYYHGSDLIGRRTC